MNFKIYDSLPHGRKNAVNAEYLCGMFGFRSKRELRQHVQRERMAGALIASGDGGYYVPETRAELLVYVHRYEEMAKSTFAMLKCARAALRQCEDQTELEFE